MKNAEILEAINYARGVVDAVIMMKLDVRDALACCAETLEEVEQKIRENSDGCTHP